MCTSLSIVNGDHYFGRTLDLDCSYGEEVCIMPRRFPLSFRRMGQWKDHYAIFGMATVAGGTPLFYEAANEYGLCMAGLNFPGNAFYPEEQAEKDNVTPFEFIPWILGQCQDVAQARRLLERINLVNIPFSPALPLSPLHWMISDTTGSIVVESMADGLHIYENPVNVMTNNPPFPYQLFNLNNYRGLRVSTPENTFGGDLNIYCQGLGGLGLPGDVSSMSRFVRIAFHAQNSHCAKTESANVGQFFHLLGAVQMPQGSCRTDAGHWDITVYTSCINASRGLYYYTTYGNRQISCVDLRREDLDGTGVIRYPLVSEEQIFYHNSVGAP